MVQVIPLRFGTIFKKVFGDLEVFNRFVSDVLGMTIEVDAVHQEYRYPEAVGRVNIEYDLFGEDARHRVVVEVQHIRESDFFERFLHYHIVSIAEQVESHEAYRVGRDVFTLVVLTTEPRDRSLRFSVAVSDMDPVNERGERLGVYRHRLVFLNPKVINELTPPKARPWLALIADSLDGEVDETQYDDPTFQRAIRAATRRAVSPDELSRIKDEAAWEDTKRIARSEGALDARRTMLRALCAALGLPLDADDQQRLDACDDADTLDRWAAAVAATRTLATLRA